MTLVLTEFGGTSTGLTGVLIMGLNALMIVTGALIRRGSAWILGINVAAIALFIELTLVPNAFAVLFAAMDAIVLFALLRHRAWFQWSPETAQEIAREAEREVAREAEAVPAPAGDER